MKKAISEETRHAVLVAAWELMSRKGRLDAGMAQIAAAAGVTRQTLFYAFGSRAGLLVAMVRHKDARGPHAARLGAIARGRGASAATLLRFLDAWLDYLPHVYPVAIQLEGAAPTDADAAAAWNDRFLKGVRRGFEMILVRMAAAGALSPASDPERLADACLALVVPSTWRLLVVECGWTRERYRRSRRALVRACLAVPP